MKISICAGGDITLLEHFSEGEGYDVNKIREAMTIDGRPCDIRIANLESVVSSWNCHASAFCGGQWINTEPERLDDIEKFGFNLYGCANNHSMDYSFQGCLSTMRELEKRGMIFAGIGASLSESSKAAIYEIPEKNVRVAFICVTSTFVDAARAGDERDGIPARPGINPLRVQTKYKVTKERFMQLQKIAEVTYINGERDNARKIGSLPPEEEGSINFGRNFFVAVEDEEAEGKFTYCNKNDYERIMNEIQQTSKLADYVVVSVHSHQIRKNSYTEPDYFQEEFAHGCIDCGACAVIGTGTHQLKPIEIYKGKPIFYSLGNFVFQNDKIKKLPADFWDKYQYPARLTVEEGMARKTRGGSIGLETDKNNYLSVVPIMEFEQDRLIQLGLLPISLQFEQESRWKGLPVIADETDAELICLTLSRISQKYGTEFERQKYIKVKL